MKINVWLAVVLLTLPIALGLYWIAAPFQGAFGWMPAHINPAYGGKVDFLYIFIMIVVAVMFFLTEGLLVWFVFRYRERPGAKAQYTHGSRKAELIWSVIPGLMLLALALGQAGTWAEIKQEFPGEKDPDTFVVQTFAQQFNWNFRYPGTDGKFGTADDIASEGRLTTPVGRKILLQMASKDVIHSLSLPHLRVKQDVVPGMMTKAWWDSDRIPVWNLADQKMEFLKPEDADKGPIATNWDGAFQWGSEILNKKTQHRKFKYTFDSSRQVQIWQDGMVRQGSPGEAKYLLHWLDLPCMEL